MQIKTVNLFAKEQLAPEFLRINPQHCVPTIDDDGFYLWESRGVLSFAHETLMKLKLLFRSQPFRNIWLNQRRQEALCTHLTRQNVRLSTKGFISVSAPSTRGFALLL